MVRIIKYILIFLMIFNVSACSNDNQGCITVPDDLIKKISNKIYINGSPDYIRSAVAYHSHNHPDYVLIAGELKFDQDDKYRDYNIGVWATDSFFIK